MEITHRIDHKPSISFSEWCALKGVAKEISDIDIAEIIGGLLCERTRHGRGKVKSRIRRMAEHNRLHAEYDKEVADGKIPMVEIKTPLNLNLEADKAYVRAMQRRAAARAAMGEGK